MRAPCPSVYCGIAWRQRQHVNGLRRAAHIDHRESAARHGANARNTARAKQLIEVLLHAVELTKEVTVDTHHCIHD